MYTERDAPKPDKELYGILGLSEDASDEEIKNSYRRMSLIFHPDKQTNPVNTELSQNQYSRIQKAYHILSDPRRRYLYDSFGPDSIGFTWDDENASPEEVKGLFEYTMKMQKLVEVENLTGAEGSVQLSFNGINPSEAHVSHSWAVNVNEKSNLRISGASTCPFDLTQAAPRGNIIGTLNYTFSPGILAEFTGIVGSNASIIATVNKQFSHSSFIRASLAKPHASQIPILSLTAGREISDNMTAFISYDTGSLITIQNKPLRLSSYTLGLVYKPDKKSKLESQVNMGAIDSTVSLTYSRDLTSDLHAKIKVDASPYSGASLKILTERKLDASFGSKAGIGYTLSTQRGIMLNLKYKKLDRRIIVPILLTPDVDLNLALGLTIAIPLIHYISDKYYFIPSLNRARQEELERKKKEFSELLEFKKKEAQNAVEIMTSSVMKKQESEKQKSEFVVIFALYGKLPFIDPREIPQMSQREETMVDVTIPVANLVKNSQLHIPPFTKSSLLGFYDPAYGEKKELAVWYTFRDTIHFVRVNDDDLVVAPLKEHALYY